jgi:hypothetical protein
MALLLEEERSIRELDLMASGICSQSPTLSFAQGLPLRAVRKDVITITCILYCEIKRTQI